MLNRRETSVLIYCGENVDMTEDPSPANSSLHTSTVSYAFFKYMPEKFSRAE